MARKETAEDALMLDAIARVLCAINKMREAEIRGWVKTIMQKQRKKEGKRKKK